MAKKVSILLQLRGVSKVFWMDFLQNLLDIGAFGFNIFYFQILLNGNEALFDHSHSMSKVKILSKK